MGELVAAVTTALPAETGVVRTRTGPVSTATGFGVMERRFEVEAVIA